MRIQRMILHIVAVATLGSMCMAESSKGCVSRDEAEKAKTQNVTQDQREMAQQNATDSQAPSSMSRDSNNMDMNGAEERAARKDYAALRYCVADPRTQERIDNVEKLTEALQQNMS